MSDFTSDFWSWWIITIVVGGIVFCIWLLLANKKSTLPAGGTAEATGHVWDEDLEELNNPLPRWWIIKFYITIVFGIAYLALYPGLGKFAGQWGWSQTSQYDTEMASADKRYGPLFAAYAKQPIEQLAKDEKAMASGQRLFLNYCATCHGSDAGGAIGFPNLSDKDWLYGGSGDQIKTSILDGRNGVMPPLGAGLTPEKLDAITAYVIQLSGREADPKLVEAGKSLYTELTCIACHGADGKGNALAGFPNLTDNIWLYGGSPGAIKETIKNGRSGKMPAHREFLGEEKAHLLAAYVYSLSQ